MKASLIVTYYDPEAKKLSMLADALISLGNCASRAYEIELVLVHNGPSYTESVNDGLSRASGDFLIVLNDDILMKDPMFLEKMCQEGCITAWQLGDFHLTEERVPDAACFGMSREVFKRMGLLDLRYKDGINFEDTDYFFKAKSLGIPFVDAHVDMVHFGNATLNTYFDSIRWDRTYHNESIFRQKWSI